MTRQSANSWPTPTRRVGAEGVITVEESKTTESTLEVVEGMQFDRGFISPYFITDPEKMEVALDDPLILLYEKKTDKYEGHASASGASREGGTPAPDYRGGCGRRSAGDAGGQQGSRDADFRRGEGARIRRPSKRNVAGHRDSHQRTINRRRTWNENRKPHARAAGPLQTRADRQGQDDDH